MFSKGDLSNRQKMSGSYLQQVLRQNLSCFCLNTRKCFFGYFILKPTEKTKVLLKNRFRDFQNSPPFEKCFYAKITGNFKQFQYCNFKTSFF